MRWVSLLKFKCGFFFNPKKDNASISPVELQRLKISQNEIFAELCLWVLKSKPRH